MSPYSVITSYSSSVATWPEVAGPLLVLQPSAESYPSLTLPDSGLVANQSVSLIQFYTERLIYSQMMSHSGTTGAQRLVHVAKRASTQLQDGTQQQAWDLLTSRSSETTC